MPAPMDMGHLPPASSALDMQVFYGGRNGGDGTNATGIQQWTKPRGSSLVCIFALSPGAGGGGGQAGAAASARVGGGGGGSGCWMLVMTPAIFLPPWIHISPGVGGAGGPANSAGAAGGTAYGMYPLPQAANVNSTLWFFPSTTARPGQGGGIGGTGGAGGTPAPVAGSGIQPFLHHAFLTSHVGGGGGTGTSGSQGGAPVGAQFQGGGGGGGVNASNVQFAGGQQCPYLAGAGPVDFWPFTGGGAVGGGTGVNGLGYFMNNPFFGLGGDGGGGNAGAGNGGNGGDGWWGCGGGGGGGATSPGNGGNGGKGGDGLVIILSW